jgi:signal transduction histidine kinase
VTPVIGRLWPRSLAARLSLLLIIALAIAQLALTLLLNTERDNVVEELLHSQALNQTVTLARLLNTRDVSETEQLLFAFQSRQSCASLGGSVPDGAMSSQERQLALTLEAMLHGNHASAPAVHVVPDVDPRAACARGDDSLIAVAQAAKGKPVGDPDGDGDRAAALIMDVQLLDGRWLRVVTAIDLSTASSSRLSLISFLVSSLAVAIVTVWMVRSQTASLRALASASDRFGRGETVETLPIRGPAEVDRATAAFNVMQGRLSQLMRDRIQLLASISHDLRTPLTTLRLKAEFIEDEAVRDDLVVTIDELTAICNTTLEFTRAEAASEPTVTLDVADLAQEVASEFQLAKVDVSLTAQSCRLSCRPVALKRALRNLIENAVRYGERARVTVLLEAGQIVIRVDDDGPGIPHERRADIFKPFVRLEPSRNSGTGGLGLGLAIAQGIVQAHGGTLILTNLPGQGTRAEIRLDQTVIETVAV